MAITETKPILQAEAGGTEITRFNALRHGVLSRYTVLPWEDADEYHALLAALAAEHTPQGPTEEHLVEELAGILWRKRRLRLAETSRAGGYIFAIPGDNGSGIGLCRRLKPVRASD